MKKEIQPRIDFRAGATQHIMEHFMSISAIALITDVLLLFREITYLT